MWMDVNTSSRAMRSLIRIEVLEVVAVPRHERAQHVPPQRQLAQLRRRTISDDLAVLHRVAHLHQRTLVDAGGLVGTHELAQPVDVDALGGAVFIGRAHHDARAVDLVHHAGAPRDDGRTAVARHRRFHAGADERCVRLDQRHRLTLHVGAHQRAVGVIVLQERDQRRGHRHQLLRRYVDRGDVLRPTSRKSPCRRTDTRSSVNCPPASIGASACATTSFSSSIAER